jgi:acetylornithine deacetylase/succinyl-diaminopimelate desuccinylase-like protein
VEGEEEIASVNLPQWVEEHRDLLDADDLLWEGGGFDEQGNVSMAEGCKGIAYFELICRAASYDLHSSLAPLVPNPAWRLVWALSTMKDQHDRITVDGYLDHVRDIPEEALERIDALPFDSAKMKQIFGIQSWINGMDDLTARRRYLLEPTMTICGLDSGYTGPGSKTVLPAEARVKIDCRLVPDLTPELAQELIREHLNTRGFNDIEITLLGGEEPVMELRESSIRQAAIAASEDTFGKTPVISPWFAGSGPMYPLSVKLDIPVISAGATWHPNSRIHSPNENIMEDKYFLGISFIGGLIDAYANI